MSVFDRYSPFIRDFIYRNGWENIRAVQVAAADVIFNSEDNLLLCSSTASGKTEAAFFPILTLYSESPPSSVGIIYIAPLKSLINDQFSRLNDLCAEADIPVWHWHGDVSSSHKEKLMKKPSGILQITPESLEALLMHKHSDIPRLFGDLRFIVIDELHSLMRADRGGQTLCLIERLSKMSGTDARRIGLSATIGDTSAAGAFLSCGTTRKTAIPAVKDTGIRWRLSMEHFYVSSSQASDPEQENDTEALDVLDEASDTAPINADPGYGYIFEHTRGKKCLIFANSREESETVTATLRKYCEHNGEKNRFLIHHGNLSSPIRQSAEALMKDDDDFSSTVTTSTLELGIDIGRLERAFQIDCPATVSSFLQRMGRTGRRGLPPEMWFVIREELPEARAVLPELIPWKLICGIAIIQLYIEERFVEPARLDRYPYSLLYHQTMSTLASFGEMTASGLAAGVLSLGAFRNITKDDYRKLLQHMVKIDHIEKTDNGGLILGLAGERQVNSFKFYAVFQENEEYSVRCESMELGTIVKPPPVGDKVAIAGGVWTVEEVDHTRHTVYCHKAKGIIPAYFGLCPGDIHTRILKRAREVLKEKRSYPYLMKNAVSRLSTARCLADSTAFADSPIVNIGGDFYCLFPWLGTYPFMALERLIKIKCADKLGISAFESSKPYFMTFRMKADKREFLKVLCNEAVKTEPSELLYPKENPVFEKYDVFVPQELVRKGFAYGVLDIKTAAEQIKEWCKNI